MQYDTTAVAADIIPLSTLKDTMLIHTLVVVRCQHYVSFSHAAAGYYRYNADTYTYCTMSTLCVVLTFCSWLLQLLQ
jgi:hypothetical protein